MKVMKNSKSAESKKGLDKLGTDFDVAYERYANRKPDIHNSRIRPEGMDFFVWLSASKRSNRAKKV